MHKFTQWKFFGMFALAAAGLSFGAGAEAATEGEFMAMKNLGQEVGRWINELKPAPASLSVFSIDMTAPLEEHLKPILLADLTHEITEGKTTKVYHCEECLAPRVQVEGDRIVVTRGAPDQKELIELGKKTGAESFLSLVVYRTAFSIMAQATLIGPNNGEMIAAESFRIPNLDFRDAATQIMIGTGAAFSFAGNGDGEGGSFPLNFNLAIMEEIAPGKGGLVIGGFSGFTRNNPIYVMPSIALRNRFKGSRIYGLTHFDAGYGFSSDSKGVMFGIGHYVFLSSFSFIHAGLLGLIPATSGETDATTMIAGTVSVGFSLGK